DEDNRASFSFLHGGNNGTAEVKNGVDMHIKSLEPAFGCQLQEPSIDRPARRVDQDVDRAQLTNGFFDTTCSFPGATDIGQNHKALSSERLDAALGSLRLGIQPTSHDCQVGAFVCQSDGSGGANPFGATGHQGDANGTGIVSLAIH